MKDNDQASLQQTVLQKAAQFGANVCFNDLPQDVIDVSKRALIDYVAVTLAGNVMPVSQQVQQYSDLQSPEGNISVFGTLNQFNASHAALCNGTAAHAMDLDDVSWTTIGHPTVSVAPAVFACAQDNGKTGKDIILSYAVGLEIMHKIAEPMMPVTSDRGWHTTPAFGCFGSAAAAASLYDMSQQDFQNALGLAASMASGIRANFGTRAKAFHAGMSAFNGVNAAQLAKAGLDAHPAAVEGADGFAQNFAGRQLSFASVEFGRNWDLQTAGLVFKQYPCCSGSHPAINAMEDLLSERSFSAEDVETIDVGVSLLGPRELVCSHPKNAIEARFSMQFALASQLIYGNVGVAEFTDQHVQDDRIQQLIPRISMSVDDELAKLGFIGTAPAKICVTLRSGEKLYRSCDLAKGNPEKPLTDAEMSHKFMACAVPVIGEQPAQELLELLFNLENIHSVQSILERVNPK